MSTIAWRPSATVFPVYRKHKSKSSTYEIMLLCTDRGLAWRRWQLCATSISYKARDRGTLAHLSEWWQIATEAASSLSPKIRAAISLDLVWPVWKSELLYYGAKKLETNSLYQFESNFMLVEFQCVIQTWQSQMEDSHIISTTKNIQNLIGQNPKCLIDLRISKYW